MLMVERKCLVCEKLFMIKESQLKHGKGRACSPHCRPKLAKPRDMHGDKNPNWRGGDGNGNVRTSTIKAKRYRYKYPEKYDAHQAVLKAIRNGTLKHPKHCEWIFCKNVDLNAHHEDYSKKLDVIWFCKKHHLERHRVLACIKPSH